MRPKPVMNPSPGGRCSCMPKSSERCATNLSSSSNVPSSRSSATRSRAVSFPALCSRSRRSTPPPASASTLRRRSSSIGPLDFVSLFIARCQRAAMQRTAFETFAQARSTTPLNFGGIAGTHVAGILVYRQRGKFGISYAQNTNGQVRCQVDAPEQKDGPEEEVRDDGKDTQRDLIDGDCSDRALHQSDHAGQRQRGGPEHCRHRCENSHAHARTPLADVI